MAADRGWIRSDGALVVAATAMAFALVCACGPRMRAALAGAVAFAAGAASLAARLDEAQAFRPALTREVTVEAAVVSVERFPTFARLRLGDARVAKPGAAPVPARIDLTLDRAGVGADGGLDRRLPGERIRARIRIRAPDGWRNPGGRDRRAEMARAGVGAVARPVHPALWVELADSGRDPRWTRAHRLRAETAAALVASGPGGPLLAALATGERGGLAPRSTDAFRRLGLAHLLAVSGLHLTLVAGLAFAAVGPLLLRIPGLARRTDVRPAALAAAVVVAAAYAFASGAGIPVRRAWVLLAAVAVSLARGRPSVRGHPLATASIAILAAEPGALFAPGAQLSFVASAALIRAAVPTGRGGGERAARRTATDLLGTTATASAVTAPLAALHFGAVAPLAVVANVVAVPWTAFVLLPSALAAAALCATGEGGISVFATHAAERMAAVTLATVEFAAAHAPGRAAGAPPSGVWLAAAAGVGAACVPARSLAVRVGLAIGVAGILAAAPPRAMDPPPPRLVALEVGQGDAFIVQGRDAAVLVDAGRARAGGPDAGARVVVPALEALGVARLDRVVVTHADLDHRGGIPAVLAAIPVGGVWIPYGSRTDDGLAVVVAAARRRDVPVLERGQGAPAEDFGDLRIAPVWPPRRGAPPGRNNRSLVVRVEVGRHRVLLPADVESDAERAMAALPSDLHADVVILPHHGSRTSSSAGWLTRVGADVALVSAPCGGRFDMPHPEVMRRSRAAGAPVWWTGRDGAVWVGLGPRLSVWGHARGGAGRCRSISARSPRAGS